jgi:hypothetical protein
MAQALCERILERAQRFDDGARIASVRRTEAHDGMCVRLETPKGSSGLVQALRDAWPLASVCVVENVVNGRKEAQVLLPDAEEQQARARGIAARSAWQEPLRKVTSVLMVLLVAACLQKAVEISRE